MPSRCSECGTADTPCWREGPSGARTLCNACGIRWKRHSGVSSRTSSSSTHGRSPEIPILQTRTRPRTARSPPAAEDDDLYSPRKAVYKPKRSRTRSRNRSPRLAPVPAPVEDKRLAVVEQLVHRVRVLEQEQKRTKYHFGLLCRHLQNHCFASQEGGFLEEIIRLEATSSESENLSTILEDRIDHMMDGDGEDEAWMLATIREPAYLPTSPMRDVDIMG